MARSDHPLRRWLIMHGKEQQELAAEIGCSKGAISEWIHGVRYPRFETLIAIYHATGGQITPNHFLPTDLRLALNLT